MFGCEDNLEVSVVVPLLWSTKLKNNKKYEISAITMLSAFMNYAVITFMIMLKSGQRHAGAYKRRGDILAALSAGRPAHAA